MCEETHTQNEDRGRGRWGQEHEEVKAETQKRGEKTQMDRVERAPTETRGLTGQVAGWLVGYLAE